MLYQDAKSQISKAIREPQGGKAILSNHQAHNVESAHKPSPAKIDTWHTTIKAK
jgi:hypothetical protein